MKKYITIYFLVCIVYLSSCGQENTYRNSEEVAFNLIKICIDSTNRWSDDYQIDFGKVDLHRKGIDNFLEQNNKEEVNLQSLMQTDSTWIEYGFFHRPIIRFEEIKILSDNTLCVEISWTEASDGSHGREIILKQERNNFIVISSEMIWIS